MARLASLASPERFRRLAQDGVSTREALRSAAAAYVKRKVRVDASDPFFSFHGRVAVEVMEHTDASDLDDALYWVE